MGREVLFFDEIWGIIAPYPYYIPYIPLPSYVSSLPTPLPFVVYRGDNPLNKVYG
jgi:hypothetical protein